MQFNIPWYQLNNKEGLSQRKNYITSVSLNVLNIADTEIDNVVRHVGNFIYILMNQTIIWRQMNK